MVLLFDFFSSSLVLLEALFAPKFGIFDAINHALNLCLLLCNSSIKFFDLTLQISNNAIEFIDMGIHLGLHLFEFLLAFLPFLF